MNSSVRQPGGRKSARHQQGNIPDLLSELPECLIARILSSLEMKDAVKTSVLSRRWKTLWTQVDNIVYNFTEDSVGEPNAVDDFIAFVDHTLMQCTCPNINMFSFIGLIYERMNLFNVKAHIDKWISFVVAKNVKCLTLDLQDEMKYVVPDCLYRCSSLTELKLSGISMLGDILSPVSWRLLTSLYLSHCWLYEDDFANILSGCPVLETILLDCVAYISNLDITSPSVKRLTMWYIEFAGVYEDMHMTINAPWLEELEIMGWFFIPRCKVLDVSSLKYAILHFTYSYETKDSEYPYCVWWNDMVYDVLGRFSHVNDLIIGAEVLQALAVSQLLGKQYPLFKCKQLEVISPMWKNDLYAIACLLQNTPYLEKLVVKLRNCQRFSVMPYASRNLDGKDLHLWLPQAKYLNLKIVEFEYVVEGIPKVIGCCDFKLVEYIMSNAVSLEKLLLWTTGDDCYNCLGFCICRNAPRLASKLVSYHLADNETMDWMLWKGGYFEFTFHNYKPIARVA